MEDTHSARAWFEYVLRSLGRAVYVALALAADPARLGRPPPCAAAPRRAAPRVPLNML